MKYYDLSSADRKQRKQEIREQLLEALSLGGNNTVIKLFGDNDTHIRKVTYLELGKLYRQHDDLKVSILQSLHKCINNKNERVRQTAVYAAGEIACVNFAPVEVLIECGLNDLHHSVRNASTGALKTAGSKNPEALQYCRVHIHSSDPEVRRLICHGLELRGRTHPQEIINILKTVQHDQNKRVQDMLIHVLGQISYKKECFHFVYEEVKRWENHVVFEKYKKEVVEVHERYAKFSEMTVEEVKSYIF